MGKEGRKDEGKDGRKGEGGGGKLEDKGLVGSMAEKDTEQDGSESSLVLRICMWQDNPRVVASKTASDGEVT